MKKFLFFIFTFSLFFCSENKFYIKGKIKPEDQVRVFLDPRLIVSGYFIDGATKEVHLVNNEKSSYNFFIPPGEQKLLYQVRYTRGVNAYVSESQTLSIQGKAGDRIFVCTAIKEVGDISPTGGMVESIPEIKLLFIKDEEKDKIYIKNDKDKQEKNRHLDQKFFKKKCNALIYGLSES